jgi:DNA-binding Xre family transcriptional regulator
MATAEKDPAEQLAREIAREALFLPDRWRAWLITALGEDLANPDFERHRLEVLNARMSEAVRVLEAVAEHLQLDPNQRLALTMREFDTAPEKVRESWRARQVADALRGSWSLAKGVAFGNERLPVAAERLWERRKKLKRKRRESAFALSGIAQWLGTKPKEKTRAVYKEWSKLENKKLEPGQKPFLQGAGLWKRWPLPWPEIVQAVEDGRLPGETGESADKEEVEVVSGAPTRSHVFILDPQLRARRLRSAREAQGWSLTEVADGAGLDPSTVKKLERATVKQPGFENIARLAEVLGLDLNDFVS